jgi:hypothetical protein
MLQLLTLTLRHCLNCVCVTWPYSLVLWSSCAASSKKGLIMMPRLPQMSAAAGAQAAAAAAHRGEHDVII